MFTLILIGLLSAPLGYVGYQHFPYQENIKSFVKEQGTGFVGIKNFFNSFWNKKSKITKLAYNFRNEFPIKYFIYTQDVTDSITQFLPLQKIYPQPYVPGGVDDPFYSEQLKMKKNQKKLKEQDAPFELKNDTDLYYRKNGKEQLLAANCIDRIDLIREHSISFSLKEDSIEGGFDDYSRHTKWQVKPHHIAIALDDTHALILTRKISPIPKKKKDEETEKNYKLSETEVSLNLYDLSRYGNCIKSFMSYFFPRRVSITASDVRYLLAYQNHHLIYIDNEEHLNMGFIENNIVKKKFELIANLPKGYRIYQDHAFFAKNGKMVVFTNDTLYAFHQGKKMYESPLAEIIQKTKFDPIIRVKDAAAFKDYLLNKKLGNLSHKFFGKEKFASTYCVFIHSSPRYPKSIFLEIESRSAPTTDDLFKNLRVRMFERIKEISLLEPGPKKKALSTLFIDPNLQKSLSESFCEYGVPFYCSEADQAYTLEVIKDALQFQNDEAESFITNFFDKAFDKLTEGPSFKNLIYRYLIQVDIETRETRLLDYNSIDRDNSCAGEEDYAPLRNKSIYKGLYADYGFSEKQNRLFFDYRPRLWKSLLGADVSILDRPYAAQWINIENLLDSSHPLERDIELIQQAFLWEKMPTSTDEQKKAKKDNAKKILDSFNAFESKKRLKLIAQTGIWSKSENGWQWQANSSPFTQMHYLLKE